MIKWIKWATLLLSIGLVAAVGWRTLGNRTIHTATINGYRVVAYRDVHVTGHDQYCYKVVTPDGVQVGPYYVGPAQGVTVHLASVWLDDVTICLYNAHQPDDVYCYVQTNPALYYPSPSSGAHLEAMNNKIQTRYRQSASLTSQFNIIE